MVADECSRCGKVVVKSNSADSSDMVRTEDSFLYLCDLLPSESGRPTLQLKEYSGMDHSRLYCLDCLLEVVTEWVEKMKARGKSKIPLNHVISGMKGITFPCPVCGR